MRATEDEFSTEGLASYEIVQQRGTNFISIFQSRFFEDRVGMSTAEEASCRLREYYDESGGGESGRNACRRLLKKAVDKYGAICSVDLLFCCGLKPVISTKEWVEWSDESAAEPSRLFKWRYGK
jgi:hypothetical protein